MCVNTDNRHANTPSVEAFENCKQSTKAILLVQAIDQDIQCQWRLQILTPTSKKAKGEPWTGLLPRRTMMTLLGWQTMSSMGLAESRQETRPAAFNRATETTMFLLNWNTEDPHAEAGSMVDCR
jgi:hypothetical protein